MNEHNTLTFKFLDHLLVFLLSFSPSFSLFVLPNLCSCTFSLQWHFGHFTMSNILQILYAVVMLTVTMSWYMDSHDKSYQKIVDVLLVVWLFLYSGDNPNVPWLICSTFSISLTSEHKCCASWGIFLLPPSLQFSSGVISSLLTFITSLGHIIYMLQLPLSSGSDDTALLLQDEKSRVRTPAHPPSPSPQIRVRTTACPLPSIKRLICSNLEECWIYWSHNVNQ